MDIAGDHSELKLLKTGVPQGSLLGSYLFILYINEIVNVDASAKCVIYADDNSRFFEDYSGSEMSNRVNETLANIHTWASNNYVKMNVEKNKGSAVSPM